ncbi:MAG: hypothetical protein H0V21_09020 [Rubrobacter sp.]|nr:hypothetical protein [Rubrobacter sp.]
MIAALARATPKIATQSVVTRTVPQGYGEGEEVALAVALAVALCSVEVVLWRVVAGRALLWGRVSSSGAVCCSVLSVVL